MSLCSLALVFFIYFFIFFFQRETCFDILLASLYDENKILKSSFKSREHIQKKETWVILRSLGYSSLISDPGIFW